MVTWRNEKAATAAGNLTLAKSAREADSANRIVNFFVIPDNGEGVGPDAIKGSQ